MQIFNQVEFHLYHRSLLIITSQTDHNGATSIPSRSFGVSRQNGSDREKPHLPRACPPNRGGLPTDEKRPCAPKATASWRCQLWGLRKFPSGPPALRKVQRRALAELRLALPAVPAPLWRHSQDGVDRRGHAVFKEKVERARNLQGGFLGHGPQNCSQRGGLVPENSPATSWKTVPQIRFWFSDVRVFVAWLAALQKMTFPDLLKKLSCFFF